MVSWRHVLGRLPFAICFGHRDRARAAAARQAARGGACEVTLLKTLRCLRCCIFKDRQSHQPAEELSGLADETSTRTELHFTSCQHRASVQEQKSAKEELCRNFNLLKSG
jgi:hypothetical protein